MSIQSVLGRPSEILVREVLSSCRRSLHAYLGQDEEYHLEMESVPHCGLKIIMQQGLGIRVEVETAWNEGMFYTQQGLSECWGKGASR